MIVDSHCHLDFEDFSVDLDEVIDRAMENGVGEMLTICTHLSRFQNILDIAERYSKLGKQVKLRHLTKDCHSLLRKTGQLIVDSDDDPDYGIAVDYGVKLGIFGK